MKMFSILMQISLPFSSLFAAGDVSRGGTSATQRQKFHTDDEERGETDVFTGYMQLKRIFTTKVFALSLVLNGGVFGTQKRPILFLTNFNFFLPGSSPLVPRSESGDD